MTWIITRRPSAVPVDWRGVPRSFRKRVSAVVRNSYEAEALVRFYGSPNWVPDMPVLLLLPTGDVLLGIDQKTHPMTASQLRDQAAGVMEREELLAKLDTHGFVMRERGAPVDGTDLLRHLPAQLVRQHIEREGMF